MKNNMGEGSVSCQTGKDPFFLSKTYLNLPASKKSSLIVVIDTEEEFDWSAGFSRGNTSVNAMRKIHRLQKVFDEFGIKPVYVIDYPIASQPQGYEPLQEIHASGRCEIGSHLHPWVSPPFEETVSRFNSFPGNLPPALEASKLQILGETIREHFGHYPVMYKAGRYGIGPHTEGILEEQGYLVDLSVCPNMDYSEEGGPDFSLFSPLPFLFGKNRKMLELPLTVGFSGYARKWGRPLHALASRPVFSSLHSVGILARLCMVDKIWLSPEGFLSSEHFKLAKDLYADGLRVFSFALHSPSVVPGHTPYVQTEADLERFLTRCSKFFEFFMKELEGQPMTPLDLYAECSPGANSVSRGTT